MPKLKKNHNTRSSKTRRLQPAAQNPSTRYLLPKTESKVAPFLVIKDSIQPTDQGEEFQDYISYDHRDLDDSDKDHMDPQKDISQTFQLCQGLVNNFGMDVDVDSGHNIHYPNGRLLPPLNKEIKIPKLVRCGAVLDLQTNRTMNDLSLPKPDTWNYSNNESMSSYEHWTWTTCIIPLLSNLQKHISRHEKILASYRRKFLQKNMSEQERLFWQQATSSIEQRLDRDRNLFKTYYQMAPRALPTIKEE